MPSAQLPTTLSARDLDDLARLCMSPIGFAQIASRGRYDTPAHLRLLNERLADVAERRVKRLMVFAPPRHGKSELISHYFSAWYLATHPEHRILLSSYGADFAATWGRKARDVLTAYGPALYGVHVSDNNSAADSWGIAEHAGGMVTAGVGGSTTGRGADVFIIDDPLKNAEEALSATYREKIWDWYQSVARTRLEPGGVIVLTMTRWHEEDLAGKLLEQAAHGGEAWEVIRLPALAEDEHDQLGRRPGEPLWPERFDIAELASIRSTLESAFWWFALYQQRPTPQGGSTFQRAWFNQRRYSSLDALPKLRTIVQSIDSAFAEGVASDYSVIATWGTDGRDYYPLGVWRAQVAYPDLIAAIKDEYARWTAWAKRNGHPRVSAVFVEQKASGQSAIQTLRRETNLPIVGIVPKGSKVERAEQVSPLFEGGRIVPPLVAEWLAEWIDEHVRFPRAKHDDMVDTSSQALARLHKDSAPIPIASARSDMMDANARALAILTGQAKGTLDASDLTADEAHAIAEQEQRAADDSVEQARQEQAQRLAHVLDMLGGITGGRIPEGLR